jgi:hypothetical protein
MSCVASTQGWLRPGEHCLTAPWQERKQEEWRMGREVRSA